MDGQNPGVEEGRIVSSLLGERQLTYIHERVSEGLPQKPFRGESALDTRGQ